MAPKRNARDVTPASSTTTIQPPIKPSSKISSSKKTPQEIALGIWDKYVDTTPQRTKLIDTFMAFLVLVGVLQFVYCVIVGNFVCLPSMYTQLEWG